MNEILAQIILGIIQGVTEWIPVSSSAAVILVMVNFFQTTDIDVLLHQALFLHLGTFFAALVYFRKDILKLTKALFKYKYQDEATKKTLKFLIITTIISGILAFLILITLKSFENQLEFTGKTITFFIAMLLLFTGTIQIKKSRLRGSELKKEREIKNSDSVILGFAQGISSLPGISRSGITISSLLLRGFDDTLALRLSFLMSLPIVLFGNLILNFQDFTKVTNSSSIYGLLVSFVLGLVTIHILIKVSKKINFGWFVLIFALLMLLSLLN